MGDMDQDKLGEWLSAYLDGELEAEERALVERLLRDDQSARDLYDELRRSVSLIASLPRQPAPPSIAEDVQAFAERATLLGDTDSSLQPSQEAPQSRSPFLRILTMAAMVGLVALGTWYVSTEVSTPGGLGQQVAMVTEDRESALLEKEESHRSAEAKKTDESLDSDFKQNLVATVGFEQKLKNGMGIEAVSTHAFANEVVHLQVAVAGEANRDTVTAKLVAYLERSRSVDLHDITLGADEAQSGIAAGAYHYEGKDGRNFSNGRERQILIRATREQLDGLLDELARATGDSDRIALSAGPLSMKGLARSRAALYGLEASPQLAMTDAFADDVESSMPEEAELDAAAAQNEAEQSGGLLEGVLRVAGVDPGTFREFASGRFDKSAAVGETRRQGSTTDTLEQNRTKAAGPRSEKFASVEVPSAADAATPSLKIKRFNRADSNTATSAIDSDDASPPFSRKKVLDRRVARKMRVAHSKPSGVAQSNVPLAVPILKDSSTSGHRLESDAIDEYILLVVRVMPSSRDSGHRPARTKPRPKSKRQEPPK